MGGSSFINQPSKTPVVTAKSKKQQEADAKAKAKAKAKTLNDEIFKYAPKQLKEGQMGRMDAPTAIAPQLAGNLQTASGDIGFLRGFGQSKGPSDQANYLTQGQRLEEQSGLENLSREQAIRQSQAFSNLAQQGGAEAGARERLASSGMSAGLKEQQALRQQGALARLGILSDDEARKLGVAQSLPGQQLNLAQEQRAGLTQDQQAKFAVDAANMDARQREIGANLGIQQAELGHRAGIYGGDQLAKAQRKAAGGGGGGLLGAIGL